MTQVATEARSRATAQWITDHVGPQRKYKPPEVKGLRRKLLRRARKSVAIRYYQLLSGHGPNLRDKIHKLNYDRRRWCEGGKQKTRHHLFTECGAWPLQITRLWRDTGKVRGWKHQGPLSQVALEGESHGGGFGFLEGHQGGGKGDRGALLGPVISVWDRMWSCKSHHRCHGPSGRVQRENKYEITHTHTYGNV